MSDWHWLESTYQLQHAFGVDWQALGDRGEKFADYMLMNHSAAVVELGEFMNEVGWKPWAKPRGWVNRDAAVSELVDVAHFLANMACALGVTDKEWEERYRSKQATNRRRQEDGYDGVTGKCPNCRRSLDDAGIMVKQEGSYCGGCSECLDV